jgi:hypothetical protein
MLGQIATRRNVLRFGALAALTAGVAACASTGTTTVSGTASGAPTTVTVTPAQVAAEASTVLTAVSGAVAAFVAANPSGVTSAIQSQIALAEKSATAAIATLGTASLTSVPADAVAVANTIVSVVTLIPELPPDVVAGAIAFQVLATALEPVLNSLPVPATLGVQPFQAGLTVKPGTRVLLVPNH